MLALQRKPKFVEQETFLQKEKNTALALCFIETPHRSSYARGHRNFYVSFHAIRHRWINSFDTVEPDSCTDRSLVSIWPCLSHFLSFPRHNVALLAYPWNTRLKTPGVWAYGKCRLTIIIFFHIYCYLVIYLFEKASALTSSMPSKPWNLSKSVALITAHCYPLTNAWWCPSSFLQFLLNLFVFLPSLFRHFLFMCKILKHQSLTVVRCLLKRIACRLRRKTWKTSLMFYF